MLVIIISILTLEVMKSYVLMFDFEYIKIDRNAYRVGNDNETYNIITSNIKNQVLLSISATSFLQQNSRDKQRTKFFSGS